MSAFAGMGGKRTGNFLFLHVLRDKYSGLSALSARVLHKPVFLAHLNAKRGARRPSPPMYMYCITVSRKSAKFPVAP
jgi:hypothetical protein